MERFVCYARVSTAKQETSGLGLEGQRTALHGYIARVGGEMVEPVFVEVESGKKNNRPILAEALKVAKRLNATLLVAKLDRLARNVSFISALQEAKVKFRACDMPEANELMVNILSAVAAYELTLVSERTKRGLAEAKKRGTVLGNKNLVEKGIAKRWNKEQLEVAKKNAERVSSVIMGMIEENDGLSVGCSAVAERFNKIGLKTVKGKSWTACGARNVLRRLNLPSRAGMPL